MEESVAPATNKSKLLLVATLSGTLLSPLEKVEEVEVELKDVETGRNSR